VNQQADSEHPQRQLRDGGGDEKTAGGAGEAKRVHGSDATVLLVQPEAPVL